MALTKICSKCKIEKLLTDFYKDKAECKKCNSIRMKAWRNKNKKYLQKYEKNRWKNNPVRREYNKSERGRERDKKFKKSEKGILSNKKHCKKYYESNIEKMHDYNIRRRPNKEINLEKTRQWAKTENGRRCRRKNETERSRRLGYNELFENQIDEIVSWHHIDNKNVVAIPRDLHELFGRGKDTKRHRGELMLIVEQLYPDIN